MKILGHAYIATHAIEGNNRPLIIGSLLPEMLPYIPNDVFEYEELHEGGKRLLEYLDSCHPEKRDLALGLLSHGVEVGSDKFSRESEKFVASKKEFLLEKISRAHEINLKTAEGRLHNYVGLGIDWLLVQNEPKLVEETQEALREFDIEEISHLLAEGFKKDETKVRAMVETLFRRIYRPEDLTSIEGLARIWARQSGGLPERDRVNIQKATEIIQECADLLEGKWKGFLESTRIRVGENLESLIAKEGRKKTSKEQEI